MGNLCHTLAGWALSEGGLRKKTPLAAAALLVRGIRWATVRIPPTP